MAELAMNVLGNKEYLDTFFAYRLRLKQLIDIR